MKFHSAALAVVVAASTTSTEVAGFAMLPSPANTGSAFVPRTSLAATTVSTPTRRGSMSMFSMAGGGIEELQTLVDASPKVTKQVVVKSPKMWKIAGMASIPLSAALGFGLVPASGIAANTVGAMVTGIAGAVGKSKMDEMAESAAKPALAQVLIDNGVDEPAATYNAVLEVQKDFGVPDEDFTAMCTEIYSKYLLGMVKHNMDPSTRELKELDKLKQCLGLDNLAVGEAHAAAAAEWYRTTSLFTPEEELEDPEHPDRIAMDKMLFLTEGVLRQGGETQEAFTYEMTRVAKAMNLSLLTAMDHVSDVTEPFYMKALRSTRANLDSGKVGPDMLVRARNTLGLSEATAKDLHISAFNEDVKQLLGKVDSEGNAVEVEDTSDMKFSKDALERLAKLSEVFGLSEDDVEYEVTVEATPLFQQTALAVMKDVLAGSKTPEEAWSLLEKRREELLLMEGSSKDLLSSMVMQALGGPLEETNKFAKVNNEAATYEHLLEALEAKEALISVLSKSGFDEFERFDETFCNPRNKNSACGFLEDTERLKMYKIFLTRTVRKSEDGKLSKEMYDKVMEVKGLLGITDDEAENEARTAFGPELQKVMKTAMAEILDDYTPELAKNLKKTIDEVMDSYKLSSHFLKETGGALYAKAVAMVSEKTPAGVPTEEQNAALEALRDLFQLKKEDTYAAHISCFAPVYKKSLLESMGSTGVILPEFRAPLEELRDRLGVSEESTKSIFLDAVREKMVPMVEWIASEMERTMLTQQQLSQRRKKDMGEDLFQTGKGATGVLGLGAEANIMSDIMNLVDFYLENDITEKKEVGTKTVEKRVAPKEEGGEEEIVKEEVPVFETSYPVTALGEDCIDTEIAELLYRQFVVGGFTTQGPQGERYEGAKATFGGILGLTSEKMQEIGSNIGSTVYDNFVTNAMQTKGEMDQQDLMFLANIQSKLGLSSEQGEKMLMDSQRKVLSEEVDVIMDDPTPDRIKAFREKCNSIGMSLSGDVGISRTRLSRMFEAEIIPPLKAGDITTENGGELVREVQESLGLEQEETERLFESMLMKLSSVAFDLIKAELLRGRQDTVVEPVKELVRYAAFVEGDLDLDVPEELANQIYNVYDALDLSDQDKETVEANKELLKTTLGLSS